MNLELRRERKKAMQRTLMKGMASIVEEGFLILALRFRGLFN
jgi:hypothetical protein